MSKESTAEIRILIQEERGRINELVKEGRLAEARELDRIVDRLDRHCRIFESKEKGE